MSYLRPVGRGFPQWNLEALTHTYRRMREHLAPLLCSLRIIRTQLPELPDSWKHKEAQMNPSPPSRQCPLTWLKPFDPIEQTICILFTQPVHPPTQTHTDAHAHTQACGDIGVTTLPSMCPHTIWHRQKQGNKLDFTSSNQFQSPLFSDNGREFCLGFSM